MFIDSRIVNSDHGHLPACYEELMQRIISEERSLSSIALYEVIGCSNNSALVWIMENWSWLEEYCDIRSVNPEYASVYICGLHMWVPRYYYKRVVIGGYTDGVNIATLEIYSIINAKYKRSEKLRRRAALTNTVDWISQRVSSLLKFQH